MSIINWVDHKEPSGVNFPNGNKLDWVQKYHDFRKKTPLNSFCKCPFISVRECRRTPLPIVNPIRYLFGFRIFIYNFLLNRYTRNFSGLYKDPEIFRYTYISRHIYEYSPDFSGCQEWRQSETPRRIHPIFLIPS